MNEYDSDKILELLGGEDYIPVESQNEADLIILNKVIKLFCYHVSKILNIAKNTKNEYCIICCW